MGRDQALRISLYNRGLSDNDAGRHLGLTGAAFQQWRHRKGLPAHWARKRRSLSPAEEERRRRAWEETSSDAEAAAALGLTLFAFQKWRAMRELPVKRLPRRPRHGKEEVLRRVAAYEMTNNDREAGALVGLSSAGFASFRKMVLRLAAKNIPTVGDRGHYMSNEQFMRRLAAYETFPTDGEAAGAIGMDPRQFAGWRCFQRLPPKARHCARCQGRVVRPPSGEPFCHRCRAYVERRRRAPWNDSAFREKVRALRGQRVVIRHRSRDGRRFRFARGILRFPKGHFDKVLVGRDVYIDKKEIGHVAPEYRGVDWPCGCGCGATVRLTYRPPHGPPFFLLGHKFRITPNHGAWKKGTTPWNKGVKGKAFWSRISPEGRIGILFGLEMGRWKASENAKGFTRARDGHIMVATDRHYSYGARVMRLRARVVMEGVLGRPLTRREIVVHLNGKNDDDRPENLFLARASDKFLLAKAKRWRLQGQDLAALLQGSKPVALPSLRARGPKAAAPPAEPIPRPRRPGLFCSCGALLQGGLCARCDAGTVKEVRHAGAAEVRVEA